MSVIPATQETKVGGSQSDISPGKVTVRPSLKKKLLSEKQTENKGLGVWLKW
jgi:hypothetical protein